MGIDRKVYKGKSGNTTKKRIVTKNKTVEIKKTPNSKTKTVKRVNPRTGKRVDIISEGKGLNTNVSRRVRTKDRKGKMVDKTYTGKVLPLKRQLTLKEKKEKKNK